MTLGKVSSLRSLGKSSLCLTEACGSVIQNRRFLVLQIVKLLTMADTPIAA